MLLYLLKMMTISTKSTATFYCEPSGLEYPSYRIYFPTSCAAFDVFKYVLCSCFNLFHSNSELVLKVKFIFYFNPISQLLSLPLSFL